MFKKIIDNIFSIKTDNLFYKTLGARKTITILGIKIKLRTEQRKETKIQKNFKNCIAFIDPVGIGDYIFVRPFWKYLKKSEYKNCQFVYFVQKRHYNFVKTHDYKYFDDIIIYDSNAKELKQILKNNKFEAIINLSARRADINISCQKQRMYVVKKIKAKQKISDVILVDTNSEPNLNKSYKIFNKFIFTHPYQFETSRRREFFEKLLNVQIPQEDIKIEPLIDFSKPYIVISPITMNENRNFPTEKWIEIINHIILKTEDSLKIVFIGGSNDYTESEKIINQLKIPSKCTNICGLTDEAMIPSILKSAKFLISPETGTVHIAESVGCKTLCLCSGVNYNRFLPHKNVNYVYSDKFFEVLNKNNEEEIKQYYFPFYNLLDMNDIQLKKIKMQIDILLEDCLNNNH